METELLTLPGRWKEEPQDLGFQLPHVPLAAANDPGELEYMKGLTEGGLHNTASMRAFSMVGWKFVVIQLCGVNPPVPGEYARKLIGSPCWTLMDLLFDLSFVPSLEYPPRNADVAGVSFSQPMKRK